MNIKKILVIFKTDFPKKNEKWWKQYSTVVAPRNFKEVAQSYDLLFVDIDELIEPGSIYEATAFAVELSRLTLADGSRITKSFIYKGYELWWMHYNNLLLYFCLPYTQYKKLLYYLKSFQSVYFWEPPYKTLFSCYLRSYGCEMKQLAKPGIKSLSFLPFGILLQIIITFLCLPVLMINRRKFMIFTGDKFEKNCDYDFRMKFIYQELRKRNFTFVEFIRSLESWKALLQHVLVRKRPIIYSEGMAFVGKFFSFVTGGYSRAKRKFGYNILSTETKPEEKFKLFVATQFLLRVYDEVWGIRVMKWILRAIGVKAAYIAATLDRNFHAVLGCKLNNIPTVGILHGVASRYYNSYDFTPGFDGKKMLSVDKYGLWSEWWKEYYLKYSKAYLPEQLFVSGPMRPLEKGSGNFAPDIRSKSGPIKILFVSEQLAVPSEVLPYLEALLEQSDVEVSFTFRHYRDGFKDWLVKNRPDLLKRDDVKIAEGGLQAAIGASDVVVGSHSTAVLEALFQYRVPIFFETQKWGDYYSLKEYGEKHSFFAKTPKELLEKVKNARAVSKDNLDKLLERYFGDPYKNGSKWVVDQLEEAFLKGCFTK